MHLDDLLGSAGIFVLLLATNAGVLGYVWMVRGERFVGKVGLLIFVVLNVVFALLFNVVFCADFFGPDLDPEPARWAGRIAAVTLWPLGVVWFGQFVVTVATAGVCLVRRGLLSGMGMLIGMGCVLMCNGFLVSLVVPPIS